MLGDFVAISVIAVTNIPGKGNLKGKGLLCLTVQGCT